MLKTEYDGKTLRLIVDGFELLSTPFISAIKLQKTYKRHCNLYFGYFVE